MSEITHGKVDEREGISPRPRSLRRAEWPEADRNAWDAACAPGARLRRGGAAAHLAQVTRDDLERRYGYFLDYLTRTGWLDLTAAAAEQVTLEQIDGFVAELRQRVRSVTLAQTIYKVRRMTGILAPGRELEWLRDIERDLAFDAVPQSRAGQLVDGARLLEAGLVMIKEGELGHDLPLITRARLIRDGLMIAILSLCPIRLKNLFALELGESLRLDGGVWWITLSRRRTKGKRTDERRLPQILQQSVNYYLSSARPVLTRQTRSWPGIDRAVDLSVHRGGLWIDSNKGQPMSYNGVEEVVSKATKRSLGVALRPHMFRACAATTAYVIAGHIPYLASALLQHTDPRVTQKHYNLSSNTQAAEAYEHLVSIEMLER